MNRRIKEPTEADVSFFSKLAEDIDKSTAGNLLCVGDLVRPVSNEYILASGCGRYDFAVVVSMEPFVLVSEHADMKWSCTVAPENYKAFGTAKPEMLEKCMKRL